MTKSCPLNISNAIFEWVVKVRVELTAMVLKSRGASSHSRCDGAFLSQEQIR